MKTVHLVIYNGSTSYVNNYFYCRIPTKGL